MPNAPVERANPANVIPVSRDDNLDFIKGFLILGMIVYHSINYFALDLYKILIYIKFVSGGFIFITGYIVAVFYSTKWIDNPFFVLKRLQIRGFKLIIIFTFVNLIISALNFQNFNSISFDLALFSANLFDIFFIGRGKMVAFEILLPIGYFLIFSPLILIIHSNRIIRLFILSLVLAYSAFMPWHLDNWSLLLIGIIGFLTGVIVSPKKISSRNRLAYSIPILAIIIYLLPWLRYSLLGYIFYIAAVFACVADISATIPNSCHLRKIPLLLGRYVLFCYLTHIIVLQLIFRLIWQQRQSSASVSSLIAIVASIILIIFVHIVELARVKFKIVDSSYRVLFG